MSRLDDLTGRVFGRLTVSSRVLTKGNTAWSCVCECGNTKVVLGSNLREGKTVSCGCKQVENRFRHGHATRSNGQSREYICWAKMLRRCSDTDSPQWKDYGGRGITVCEQWRDFTVFLRDMGNAPSSKYTVERIDNNKGYEPSNCKWATRKEQARNRRDNHLVTHDGKTLTIMEWSEITGFRFNLIWDRLNRGWSVDDALTVPPNRRNRRCVQ